MNISEKLRYLIETKEKIKDSINFVGGVESITTSDPFRSYSDKIRCLSGGESITIEATGGIAERIALATNMPESVDITIKAIAAIK